MIYSCLDYLDLARPLPYRLPDTPFRKELPSPQDPQPSGFFRDSQFLNRCFRCHLQTVRQIIWNPVQSVAMGILAGTVTAFAIPRLQMGLINGLLEPYLAFRIGSLHPPLTSTDLHCTLLFAWLVRFGLGSLQQLLPTGALTALGILPIGIKLPQDVIYAVYPQLLLFGALLLIESFVLSLSSFEQSEGLFLIAFSFGTCLFISPKTTVEIFPNSYINPWQNPKHLQTFLNSTSATFPLLTAYLLSQGLAILLTQKSGRG